MQESCCATAGTCCQLQYRASLGFGSRGQSLALLAKSGRGWVDAYRVLHPEGQDYTWWSNRGAARANNVGWRIDYQFVTPSLRDRLRACSIYREQRFSDHAPFSVDYDL